MNEKIYNLLNEQMNLELESAYLYRQISNYGEINNLPGLASWMLIQSDEEEDHSDKIHKFLLDSNQNPKYRELAAYDTDFSGMKEVLEAVLAHEQKVTKSIFHIYEVAVEKKDYFTQTLLHWFISEQLEEEATVQELLDRLALFPDSHVLLFDNELAKRK